MELNLDIAAHGSIDRSNRGSFPARQVEPLVVMVGLRGEDRLRAAFSSRDRSWGRRSCCRRVPHAGHSNVGMPGNISPAVFVGARRARLAFFAGRFTPATVGGLEDKALQFGGASHIRRSPVAYSAAALPPPPCPVGPSNNTLQMQTPRSRKCEPNGKRGERKGEQRPT